MAKTLTYLFQRLLRPAQLRVRCNLWLPQRLNKIIPEDRRSGSIKSDKLRFSHGLPPIWLQPAYRTQVAVSNVGRQFQWHHASATGLVGGCFEQSVFSICFGRALSSPLWERYKRAVQISLRRCSKVQCFCGLWCARSLPLRSPVFLLQSLAFTVKAQRGEKVSDPRDSGLSGNSRGKSQRGWC